MNNKEKITELIAKGKTREGLQYFLEALPHVHALRDSVLQISNRHFTLEDQIQKGIINQENQAIEKNQISNAIIGLLKSWENNNDSNQLSTAIKNLPIPPDSTINTLHLVNCDRRTPTKRFRRAFNNLRDQKRAFQFYFLCGCPNEMPGSLAERLIYQFIEEEAGEHQLPVNYRARENVNHRVRIEKLPLGSDLASSRKKFKAYVQERFSFVDTQSFENFIETGVPKLPYSYVVSVFELSYKDWEDDEGEICSYFQWMIDTFQCPHPDVPTFLFFFVVKIPDLHHEDQLTKEKRKVLQELEGLCTKNESALIKELQPVEIPDVHEWFSEIGISNPNLIRPILQALETGLGKKERDMYLQEERVHMKDIELIQQAVFDYAKR